MAILNLYSKRNNIPSDVFCYDKFSDKLKIQINHIWNNFFKQLDEHQIREVWKEIYQKLLEEHGKIRLTNHSSFDSYESEVQMYLRINPIIEECFDIIELVGSYISVVPQVYTYNKILRYSANEVVEDINRRFLENAFGYEIRNGEIIRIDNKLLHKEVILNTLQFLAESNFKNANDEYLNAHEHYRHSRTKECLVDCLKAMESTMKIICKQNNWPHKQTDNAATLIKICIDNKLIPDFMLQHFSALRSSLESGVPTIRNKMGGHGQGTEVITVPMHYASYMLYLTGTTINFLVACEQNLNLS